MFTKFMTRNMFPHLTDNAPFGGAIVPVESRDPEIEVIERVAPTLQQRLQNLPISDPEMRKKRQEIVSRVAVVSMEAETFLDEMLQQRNANLEESLESIRAQGRQQLAVVEQLQIAHDHAVTNLRNLREEAENLGEQIKDLRRVPISKWASKETREARKKKIERCQVQLREAVNQVAAAGREQQAVWSELQEARQEMGKISNAEARCRGALSGKPFVDPELGLIAEPV